MVAKNPCLLSHLWINANSVHSWMLSKITLLPCAISFITYRDLLHALSNVIMTSAAYTPAAVISDYR